jgi:hypothetical protein
MTEPVIVGMHACKWVKDATTQMLSLHLNTNEPAGTYSLQNDTDGTDYQIPVGKKFIVLQLLLGSQGGGTPSNNTMSLFQHNVQNAAGGTEVTKMVITEHEANETIVINMYAELTAGNYLNLTSSSARSNCALIGVECDV